MSDEVISEVRRISKDKKINYLLVLCHIFFIRILVSLIPSVIISIITFVIGTILKVIGINILTQSFYFTMETVSTIVTYLTFLVTSPVLFGGMNYFYNEAKEEDKDSSIYKYLGNGKLCLKQICMMFSLTFGTLLGLVLFIVPGIIYISNRIMAPLILIDNENLRVKDAMKKSKEIMENRKSELLKIILRLLLIPIGLYIVGTYVGHFGEGMIIISGLLLMAAVILLIFAIIDISLVIPVMYTKIRGKKSGAIDVEFKEIND